MLWAESKGLMKGILWEASHLWRSTLASLWHCSSFREQKAQRGQAAVCRRPRLSQTWDRRLNERLSLGRLSLHPTSRTYCRTVDVFCPKALCQAPPPPPFWMVGYSIPRRSSSTSGNQNIFITSSDLFPKVPNSPHQVIHRHLTWGKVTVLA